jgi:hypothetical protein
MDLMCTAILRKCVFIALLLAAYEIIDHVFLRGFKTPEVLADDPKAIALLLGMLAVAVALA